MTEQLTLSLLFTRGISNTLYVLITLILKINVSTIITLSLQMRIEPQKVSNLPTVRDNKQKAGN